MQLSLEFVLLRKAVTVCLDNELIIQPLCALWYDVKEANEMLPAVIWLDSHWELYELHVPFIIVV